MVVVMKTIKKGFTFIELIIASLVLAIIAMLAIPSFSNMLAKQKLNSDIRSLSGALTQSRGQAVFLRKDVQINFTEGANTDTQYYWSINPQNKLISPATLSSLTFKKDGALSAVTADIEFKLCNSKIGITKNLILTKSGSIFYKADGTC